MRFFLILIMGFFTNKVLADAGALITITPDFQTMVLGRSMDVWQDPSGQATLETILKTSKGQDRFVPSTVDIPRGGISTSTYWARFTIVNPQLHAQPLYLEFQNPVVDRVELFQLLQGDSYKIFPAQGDQQPFIDRFLTDSPVFTLDVPPGETTFYLNYKASGNAHLMPLFLWKHEAYIDKAVYQMTFNAAVLGSLLALACYNLFLCFKLRLRMYFYYVCYIFVTIASVAITNGFLKTFLFKDAGSSKLFDEGYPASTNLCGVFIGLFAIHFLDLRTQQPRMAHLLRIITFGLAFASALVWFYKTPGVLVSLPLGLGLFCVLIISAIRSVWQGFRPARTYLLAWSMLIGSGIIWLLSLYGIGITTEQSMWLLRGSIVMETVLIALAIGEKVRLEQAVAQQRIETQVQHIQELNQELRKKEAARTAFFNNTSHELRTPLNGIIGFLDLLQRGQYGALTADVSKILHKVKSLSASLKMQVNDILELAKSQKGQLRVHCSRFSVHDLVDDITVLAEGLALKARLTTFEVQIEESGDVAQSFVSDYEKLLASVRNLVSNAFKFRKRNESNHVLIRFEYTSEQLHVMVRDQGIGLKPEDFDRIFDEFAQVEDDSRRAYEGTGLGLALAAKYVGLLQGEIKLQSEPGQGSCFTLSIPNQRQALPEVPLLARDIPHATVVPTAWSEGPPSIVTASPVSQESGKEGRILIVDDNAANGEIFSAILQSCGYSILYVMSGQEALDVLPSFQPDLILLDMMMPEFSGDDVLSALRQHAEFRKIPVIVVTARAHDDDRIQALKAGADEYLPKPILPEELLLRVENVLARHTLVREMVQKAILRGELEAARQVQQALVDNALVIPGLQFGSFYKPADESGGDWFGALYEPERSLVFLFMGDVTGHGISSALLTGVVHGAIKGIFHYATLRNQNLALQEFMIQLAQATDRTLLDLANRTERWMTMAFIGIDLKNGQGVLVNAGHQVVYHIRDNKPKPLLCFGNPLGTGRVLNPQVLTFDFHDGDRLFLYTDGLMETGDEQRPVRRQKSLEDLLTSCDEGEPLIQAILSRFNDLQQSHRVDDVSILHVKRVAHEDSPDKPIANVS